MADRFGELLEEYKNKPETLVANLYGGPGTGKSTTASGVFYKLKQEGIVAEMAHEWVKEGAWEKRAKIFTYQPYIMAKQAYRIHRLVGEVEVVITDSPILLGCVYDDGSFGSHWTPFLKDLHDRHNNLDIFLTRDRMHPYVSKGRSQTEEEARQLDRDIFNLLSERDKPFRSLVMGDDDLPVNTIVKWIKKELDD
jgi:nicotinamide riboside kinase